MSIKNLQILILTLMLILASSFTLASGNMDMDEAETLLLQYIEVFYTLPGTEVIEPPPAPTIEPTSIEVGNKKTIFEDESPEKEVVRKGQRVPREHWAQATAEAAFEEGRRVGYWDFNRINLAAVMALNSDIESEKHEALVYLIKASHEIVSQHQLQRKTYIDRMSDWYIWGPVAYGAVWAVVDTVQWIRGKGAAAATREVSETLLTRTSRFLSRLSQLFRVGPLRKPVQPVAEEALRWEGQKFLQQVMQKGKAAGQARLARLTDKFANSRRFRIGLVLAASTPILSYIHHQYEEGDIDRHLHGEPKDPFELYRGTLIARVIDLSLMSCDLYAELDAIPKEELAQFAENKDAVKIMTEEFQRLEGSLARIQKEANWLEVPYELSLDEFYAKMRSLERDFDSKEQVIAEAFAVKSAQCKPPTGSFTVTLKSVRTRLDLARRILDRLQ